MSDFRRTYLDWPHEITIETYAKCNAVCSFCTYPTLERIGTKMTDAMIDRIIEELKDHPAPFMIAPFKTNEAFLDKRTIPLCEKINRELPKAYLRLFTNGSTITVRLLEQIAKLERVVHYWVSLNEHEAAPYEALMGLKFSQTTAKLDMLHASIEAGAFRHPVTVSKVASGDGRDQAFVEYVRTRWPLFDIHVIGKDDRQEPVDRGPVPNTPCGRWFEVNIMATGKVALCCLDEGEHAIGDLNSQSLFEVYNQPEQRMRRLKMMSRRDAGGLCEGCTY